MVSVYSIFCHRTIILRQTSGPESGEEYDESECATVSDSDQPRVRSRIIGGDNAKSGEIPWHVAIFYDDVSIRFRIS